MTRTFTWKPCQRCGEPIKARSSAKTYCRDCLKANAREAARRRVLTDEQRARRREANRRYIEKHRDEWNVYLRQRRLRQAYKKLGLL
jgi:hypothetical protein